jgi:hypothetical protein
MEMRESYCSSYAQFQVALCTWQSAVGIVERSIAHADAKICGKHVETPSLELDTYVNRLPAAFIPFFQTRPNLTKWYES